MEVSIVVTKNSLAPRMISTLVASFNAVIFSENDSEFVCVAFFSIILALLAAALVALWKKVYHFQALIKFSFEIRFKFFSSNLEFS